MDTNSTLFNQFANCPTVIGSPVSLETPEKGPYRLQIAMQDHFAEVLKIVLDRGYGVDVLSPSPQIKIEGGHPNPHLGDLFAVITQLKPVGDTFRPFAEAMDSYKEDLRVHAGLLNGDYVIQYRPDDMNEAMKNLIHKQGLTHDEHVTRHMNAIYHLLDRANGGRYLRACELN